MTVATSERQLPCWRVRQWTDIRMGEPRVGTHGAEVRKRLRTDEERLEKFAGQVELVLRNKCAHYEPVVKAVRVNRLPQLMVEMHVRAANYNDAVSKVRYWIRRSFAARQAVRPVPEIPYGKVEAEPI